MIWYVSRETKETGSPVRLDRYSAQRERNAAWSFKITAVSPILICAGCPKLGHPSTAATPGSADLRNVFLSILAPEGVDACTLGRVTTSVKRVQPRRADRHAPV